MQSILQGQVEIKADIKKLDEKIDLVEERLTKRLDSIGSQVAYLDDDVPTNKEFRKLEKRVSKVEKKVALI